MENTEAKFILIDKPADWTSHDVVGYLRKKMGVKKIGHAGTLDPFATGLLICGVGREATRRLDEFKGMDKVYLAKIRLGAISDTQDKMGKISKNKVAQIPHQQKIQEILTGFLGKQLQTPPMFSAKKIKGQKLYDLARAGITVERKPNEIEIYSIDLKSYAWPYLEIEVKCSTGTYIRTLAHDIGQKLGVGAYCEELRRMAIGNYKVENAEKINN